MWLFIVWEAAPVPWFSLRERRFRLHILHLERPLAALVRSYILFASMKRSIGL
jgi:hypothetical protein